MNVVKKLVCIIGFTALSTSYAVAGNYVVLGNANKSIETLGKPPAKKKKVLKLGGLRTVEAQLPNGILTLDDRMRLRFKHARDRQRAVSNSKRRRTAARNHTNEEPYTDEYEDQDLAGDDGNILE